mgnify:CR=1 FL=1
MEVMLDTSFILTCLKEKIDFLEAEEFGRLVIPKQVIAELEKIKKVGKKLKERPLAELALQIIEKNTEKFKFVSLEKEFVDKGIVLYVKEREKAGEEMIVATLDREIKKELKEKASFLIIRAGKKLEIV